MSGIQEQARALGDPTRHAIFRHVTESTSPVTVRELTEQFGLNHNAVRQHLAKLVAAGLVVEEREAPSGPGRPRLLYTVDPGAESRWGVTGPYERLSLLLRRPGYCSSSASNGGAVTHYCATGKTLFFSFGFHFRGDFQSTHLKIGGHLSTCIIGII